MRLGDLDALDNMLAGAQIECKRNGGNFMFGVLSTVRENIKMMPTVDAIQVEWLKKRRDIYLKSYHAGHDCDLHTAAILNDTLMAWRKEQEAR